jgi:hypothetical protein
MKRTIRMQGHPLGYEHQEAREAARDQSEAVMTRCAGSGAVRMAG